MKKFIYLIKSVFPKKFLDKLRPFYHFVLAYSSALFYLFPSEKIVVIGVTGTSGKTSTVYLMAKALNMAGYKTGYTSTAMFGDGKNEWLNDKKMTMPGRFFVQKMLRKMVKNNCRYAIIETTSEGIRQFRHRFINYDVACFTGLYPEHIESHGSFDNYKKTKGQLFAHLKKCRSKYVDKDGSVVNIGNNLSKINYTKIKKSFILNGDDEHFSFFSAFWSEDRVVYSSGGLLKDGSIVVSYRNSDNNSNSFLINYPDKYSNGQVSVEKNISLSLLGDFNIVNSMPLLCLSLLQNLNMDLLIEKLSKIKNIPGRLEIIELGQKFLAIVDYAYEPIAVEKLYRVVDSLKSEGSRFKSGKLIHVLGSAGGGRDKNRRFVLGEMSGKKADFVIITNEDPYDENPLDIINQVSLGSKSAGKIEGQNLFRILDRREAIKKALSLVGNNDILLLTGKGSEQAICLKNGEKKKWDDRLVLKEEILIKIK